jgi:hypothetical protein
MGLMQGKAETRPLTSQSTIAECVLDQLLVIGSTYSTVLYCTRHTNTCVPLLVMNRLQSLPGAFYKGNVLQSPSAQL